MATEAEIKSELAERGWASPQEAIKDALDAFGGQFDFDACRLLRLPVRWKRLMPIRDSNPENLPLASSVSLTVEVRREIGWFGLEKVARYVGCIKGLPGSDVVLHMNTTDK